MLDHLRLNYKSYPTYPDMRAAITAYFRQSRTWGNDDGMDVGAFNRQNDRTWDRQPGKGKKEKGKGKGKDQDQGKGNGKSKAQGGG